MLLCLCLHGMRPRGLSWWISWFLSFCSCWCWWDLEYEEIKWQDLPHPTHSYRPPTLEHAAVTLVCMWSWLQTPWDTRCEIHEHRSTRVQCLLKPLAAAWELYLNLSFILCSETLGVDFCWAGLPSDQSIIMPTDRNLHQRSRKATFPCSLHNLAQS